MRPNGEVEIDVPYYLEFSQLYHILCKCDRKASKKYHLYSKIVDMGEDNLKADLDMVRFIRRKRMHGFGLHFILGNSLRNLSARLSFSRPLRPM